MTTTTGQETPTLLVLPALVVRHAPTADGEEPAAWCAQVCDPASPLVGLYAFGDTLAGAREALAVAAWAAIVDGELTPCGIALDDLVGIRVVASTAATYDAPWLAAAVTDVS